MQNLKLSMSFSDETPLDETTACPKAGSLMQTIKLSVVLADENPPDLELHLCAGEFACEVLITPTANRSVGQTTSLDEEHRSRCKGGQAVPSDVIVLLSPSAETKESAANDEYVLGGYAGI